MTVGTTEGTNVVFDGGAVGAVDGVDDSDEIGIVDGADVG